VNKLRSILNILIIAFILTIHMIIGAVEPDGHSTLPNRNIGLYLNAGYQYSQWEIKPDFIGEPFLDFATEGLEQINIAAIIFLRDYDFMIYTYEGPLVPTNRQNEMFTYNTVQEYGLEKYTGGIDLYPIADIIFPSDAAIYKYFLKPIFSIKFKYTSELFFGEATSSNIFYYVPLNDAFNPYNINPDELQLVETGEIVGFKTYFTDYEISIAFETSYEHSFRIGYFSSHWKRPSDYFYYWANTDYPLIFGTRYYAEGLWFGLQSQKQTTPEFHFDLYARITGIGSCSMKNAYTDLDREFRNIDGSWLNYIGLYAKAWYNYYPKDIKFKNFSMTVGGSWERRNWSREYGESESGESRFDVIDRDDIIKGYASIAIRF